MKILLLLSRCDQTGMTTHTLDLGRALVSLGHRVTLLVGRRKKNLPESEILYQKFLEVGVQVVSFRDAIPFIKLRFKKMCYFLLFGIGLI